MARGISRLKKKENNNNMPIYVIGGGTTYVEVNNEKIITDGVKRIFNTVFPFISGSIEVLLNGQELFSGIEGQFREIGNSSFELIGGIFTPTEIDYLVVDYLRIP